MKRGSLVVVLSTTLGACLLDLDSEQNGAEPLWYSTCGDPACSGYSGPFEGVPVCTTEAAGDPCETLGAECDLESDCNVFLLCATDDPTQQPGGCPISLARYKRDVSYLTASDRARIEAELRAMKLATWNYNWDAKDSAPRLGFVIDDQPTSSAVHADGEHVDLYGFTSMAVAALQAQADRIDALEAEVRMLREAIDATPRGPAYAR